MSLHQHADAEDGAEISETDEAAAADILAEAEVELEHCTEEDDDGKVV